MPSPLTEDEIIAAHLLAAQADPTLWVAQMDEPGFAIRVAVCEVPDGWVTVEVWADAEETTVDHFDTEEEARTAAHEMIRIGREQAREAAENPGPLGD